VSNEFDTLHTVGLPVLLLCFMTGPGARSLRACQMRSVLSRDVLTMRCEPAVWENTGFQLLHPR